MFGDQRDAADYRGQRSTMPARQRTGATYGGGRSLRRAMARLARRVKAFESIDSRKKPSFKRPGSMST